MSRSLGLLRYRFCGFFPVNKYRKVAYSQVPGLCTLLKMGRYYSTTLCHYWDMSVK